MTKMGMGLSIAITLATIAPLAGAAEREGARKHSEGSLPAVDAEARLLFIEEELGALREKLEKGAGVTVSTVATGLEQLAGRFARVLRHVRFNDREDGLFLRRTVLELRDQIAAAHRSPNVDKLDLRRKESRKAAPVAALAEAARSLVDRILYAREAAKPAR